MSRWSLLIFRLPVQRSRLKNSFEPSVLSTLYILIPSLLALDRFCFYREDKPWGHVSETFLVFFVLFFVRLCHFLIFSLKSTSKLLVLPLNIVLNILFHVVCENETYGENCVHNCSGNCLNDSPCNRQTGHCEGGCKPGYTKALCNKRM